MTLLQRKVFLQLLANMGFAGICIYTYISQPNQDQRKASLLNVIAVSGVVGSAIYCIGRLGFAIREQERENQLER